MLDMLQIELQPGERERLEAIARRKGYDTPDDYVRTLVEEALDEPYEDSDEQIVADLREAWRDVKRGNILSEEDFWKELGKDD